MSKILRVNCPQFTMRSSWKCAKGDDGKWKISYGPSKTTSTKEFAYSFTSGTKILSATLVVTVSLSYTKVSMLKLNGVQMTSKGAGVYSSSVTLDSTSGSFKAAFEFKCTGVAVANTSEHYCDATFSEVYLQIVYQGETTQDTRRRVASKGFKPPRQSVCIWDTADGSIYVFDGVMKIQHTLSMDIKDEPDGARKSQYVNNAFNEPDKVTFDIMMSDVYSSSTAILNNSGTLTTDQEAALNMAKLNLSNWKDHSFTRSELAFYTLHWLKEQRRKLTVVTPQFIYTEMLISSLTVNQEENTPFGWEGQIGFQHTFLPKPAKKNYNPKVEEGPETGNPSLLERALDYVTHLGDNLGNLVGGK